MELLTIAEVAKRLKLNKTDTYELINKGVIPYVVLGSKKVADFVLDEFIRNSVGRDFTDLDNVKPNVKEKNNEEN